MNTTTGVRPPHLGEEDLLRWIDRQLDLEHSRRVRGHLSACESCTARLDVLRERSRTVSSWIDEIPVRLPDPSRRALALTAVERARTRRRMRPTGAVGSLLRVAAMVLVLLGATLGTSAGRTWMGDRVQQAVGRDPGPLGSAILRVLGRDPERARLAVRTATPGADPGRPPG
ncbi:MAG: hypothetical protein JWM27_1308, partial [Gemmatimonadetes bacterium]|nr:hypothetical protein [Gemmatimonadota bacterium]